LTVASVGPYALSMRCVLAHRVTSSGGHRSAPTVTVTPGGTTPSGSAARAAGGSAKWVIR
jgi:hypothetical protein